MKNSNQDSIYRKSEGNDFFKRNFPEIDDSTLRDHKREIANMISEAQVQPKSVLEFGCNYGDLLYHYQQQGAKCVGIDASSLALEKARSLYGESVSWIEGTIADNPINIQEKYQCSFDLVIIEDVFAWVSRETLFQSITNIDDLVTEGGFLFIRDFFPKEFTKNRNHHIDTYDVYNCKIPGSHAQIFINSGIYQTVSQKIFNDSPLGAGFKSGREFENRWADTLLKKSYHGYYNGPDSP